MEMNSSVVSDAAVLSSFAVRVARDAFLDDILNLELDEIISFHNDLKSLEGHSAREIAQMLVSRAPNLGPNAIRMKDIWTRFCNDYQALISAYFDQPSQGALTQYNLLLDHLDAFALRLESLIPEQ